MTPTWQQALLNLREVKGLDFTEIATRVHASEKSVRRWYQTAKGGAGTTPLPSLADAILRADLS